MLTPPKGKVNDLLFYGNYGGPFTSNQKTSPPIDALDMACKFHDKGLDGLLW